MSITFPKIELRRYKDNLDEGYPICTVRVANEYGKYKKNMVYHNQYLGKLKVVFLKRVKKPTDIPWWNTIKNKRFRKEIKKYIPQGADCLCLRLVGQKVKETKYKNGLVMFRDIYEKSKLKRHIFFTTKPKYHKYLTVIYNDKGKIQEYIKHKPDGKG